MNVELRQQWSEERAYRAGLGLSYVLLGISILLLVINIAAHRVSAILYDTNAIIGCAASILLTHRLKPRRHFVWIPMYVCAFITYIPAAWLTGGLYSPWIGMYLAMMLILGSVVQTRISILTNFIVCSLHIPAWYLAHIYLPSPVGVGAIRPIGIMMLAAWIFLVGLAYCISFLLRAERELSEEIEKRYAELYETKAILAREEASNQAKSSFLANVSHELRTPLGAIMGYTSFLKEEELTDQERKNFVEVIDRNSRQLGRLVNDLLDLSKIEAGQLEIEKIEFSLKDLLSDVLLSFGPQASEKNLDLRVSSDRPLNDRLRADPYRLKQLLMNLVGNAVKFTESGAVVINVDCQPGEPLKIRVRDTGRGIPVEGRERLFKPFSQCDASMTRIYGGTGLGLHYSRKLSRLMGGGLELVSSEPGVGTEFLLWIAVDVIADSRVPLDFVEAQAPLQGQ